MALLLGLRRLALSILDHALQVPALVLGSRGERADALPVLSAGPGVPTDRRAAGSVHLRTDASGAAVLCVSTGSAWGAPIEAVETAAAAAQTDADAAQGAADAAQGTADGVRSDLDALSELLGDLTTIVGPTAPEGYPADLAAGFALLSSLVNGALAASKVRAVTVIVPAGQTSGTASLGNTWSNKPVFVSPQANPGLAVQRWGSVTNGTVTVTTSAAPAADVAHYVLIVDV